MKRSAKTTKKAMLDALQPRYYVFEWDGNTPNEALQGLYDWCVTNGFIK